VSLETTGPRKLALEVTVSFGEAVLDIRHVLPPKGLVIGEGRSADLFVSSEALPVREFPLIRYEDGHFILTFTSDQRGEISLDDTITPLPWFKTKEGVTPDPFFADSFRYVLPERCVVTLRFDGLNIALKYVSAPERLQESPARRDLRYSAILLSVSVVVLGAWLGFFLFGSAPEQVTPDAIAAVAQRTARLYISGDLPQPEAPVRRFSSLTSPLTLGLISRDDAERALTRQERQLNGCFTLLAPGTPVHARVEVDADGASYLASVTVHDEDRERGARGERCLQEAFYGLKFNPPLDGAAVVDFRLRPR
jgi:hypothetical protein